MASELDEGDDPDPAIAALRRKLQPALVAFRARDPDALLAWTIDPAREPALRTFGAGLLVRLGVSDAAELFVASFARLDVEQFRWFDDIDYALTRATDGVAYSVQDVLICGALNEWDGALEQLIAIRSKLDGGSFSDNCCGLTLYATAYTDLAIERFASPELRDDLVHAFEEESSPADAARVLEHLNKHHYDEAQQETLRLELLPVLRQKARSREPAVCEWLRCAELGGLLAR